MPSAHLIKLVDYMPPPFGVPMVDLSIELGRTETIVRNTMRVVRDKTQEKQPLRLNGEGQNVISVQLDNRALDQDSFCMSDKELVFDRCPDDFVLTIVSTFDPSTNKSCRGVFEIDQVLLSQCEPHGFRRITFFPDRPDVLSRYTVKLIGSLQAYPMMLSNGNRTGEGLLGDGRWWVSWRDPYPKPCYLFAIVAGRLAESNSSFVTRSGRTISLSVFTEPQYIEQCQFAMQSLKQAMHWDEAKYGLECDVEHYSIVAVTGYGSAMENKGLNVFDTSGIAASPEMTTDDDALLVRRIIGHEYFHNWTGNRVTLRDWFQLSLKEGLTRYRDQRFTEDFTAGTFRIDAVKALMRNQYPEDDGPAAHAIQPKCYSTIENFYTNTIYEKSAEVFRMLEALLGSPTYHRGFDLYINQYDGRAATLDDFVAAMELASGTDLTQFRRWYTNIGRPRVQITSSYDHGARRYQIHAVQSFPQDRGGDTKEPFHIPIRCALFSSAGAPISFSSERESSAVLETTLQLRDWKQTFTLHNIAECPVPSLLRGFSAPVSMDIQLSSAQLTTLMLGDNDPYRRWESAQTLLSDEIRRRASTADNDISNVLPDYLAGAFQVLMQSQDDDLLKAQILSLPDEPELSDGLDTIPLDSHMNARETVKRLLGRELSRELQIQLNKPQPTIWGLAEPRSTGFRKLRAVCLEYLMAADPDSWAGICLRDACDPTSMSKSYHALSILVHYDRPERDAALNWFYWKWKTCAPALDKWFAAQALSRMPAAVHRIIELAQHPELDVRNVARVNSFYGNFFRQNRVAFHDKCGKGYEFLADWLVKNDTLGRGRANRYMPLINQWRRFDSTRQELMTKALQKVVDTPGISSALRDTVNQSLGM